MRRPPGTTGTQNKKEMVRDVAYSTKAKGKPYARATNRHEPETPKGKIAPEQRSARRGQTPERMAKQKQVAGTFFSGLVDPLCLTLPKLTHLPMLLSDPRSGIVAVPLSLFTLKRLNS